MNVVSRREWSDEKYERIIETVYESGDRCTSYFPRRTPEEAAAREERIRKALAHLATRMIEIKGYEWAREHLEAKETV